MKYTLSQIAEITSGELIGAEYGQRVVESLATDSRSGVDVQVSIFVAIKGPTHDGHTYIESLLERGVRNFMVHSMAVVTPEALAQGAAFVVVDNTLAALQRFASYHRSTFKGTLLAITGSNGKTIVKEWVAQLWKSENGTMFRSPRSYNSQLGVALSLLMIQGEERLVVIEAGISKPGEMQKLEAMIRPDVGLITNIGQAHSENFESLEQKMDEKLKLFAHSKTIIYDHSDKLLDKALRGRGVSFAGSSDLPTDRNIAAVQAIYKTLGLDCKPKSELTDVAMRLEVQQGVWGSTMINDSYSCDLTSLGIALDYQSVVAGKGQGKALILSDILQSGIGNRELYSRVAQLVEQYSIENFVGVGLAISAHSYLFGRGRFYATTGQLLKDLRSREFAGQAILVKGGRVFGFERISALMVQKSHTTTLMVNLEAMASNLKHYRSLLPPRVKTVAMVKANSYGSGDVEVAHMLENQRVDYLAVAYADEGVTLRKDGDCHLPIIVLNADPGSFDTMIEHMLEPEIYSLGSLRSYVLQIKRFGLSNQPIHIKFDTGMHRLGFMEEDLCELFAELLGQQNVRVASVFSHLSCSEDKAEDEFTRGQIALFKTMTDRLAETLGYMPIRHICNSSGIERFPEAYFDMVRLGIGLYAWSTGDVVSRLTTQIVQIKSIKPGESIGYSRRAIVEHPTIIAILPIGYADGLDRRLSCGVGEVAIAGHRCPIIGNISMDTCMVDVTAIGDKIQEGDEVEIFGQTITVQEVARKLDTIPYEILTSVSSRIKRIYLLN